MHYAEKLVAATKRNTQDPNELLRCEPLSKDVLWIPEELLSLHGTEHYPALTDEQRLKLSHLEFLLLCSINCYGEKEVISNMAAIMMKKKFRSHQEYLTHFLREECEHINVFSHFVRMHGTFYEIPYLYVQGDMWKNDDLADLAVFLHVYIFEVIGHELNRVIGNDETVPDAVRALNRYHMRDEGRHLAFGQQLLDELAASVIPSLEPAALVRLQDHAWHYLSTLHRQYHNLKLYRDLGLPNAFNVRDELIEQSNLGYFFIDDRSKKALTRLIAYLKDTKLIAPSAEASTLRRKGTQIAL